MKIKCKDSFCEAEKGWVLSKLQVLHNTKLLGIYRD